MKTKHTILLVAALMIATVSKAQKKFQFGVRAGYNISTIKADPIEFEGPSFSLGSQGGFNAGLFSEYKLNAKWGLQAEVNYSQIGAKDENDEFSVEIDINTIAIPVLAKFHMKKLAFVAGPQLSLISSAEQKFGYLDDYFTYDAKDGLKSSDFSLIFGGEYTLIKGISAGARYQLGLVDFAKETDKFKSNVLSFNIGYRF